MTGTTTSTTAAAYQAFTEHRRYPYRGCAPDPVLPSRMAGDLNLPLGAHQAPDVDGGEPQAARVAREEAAVEVCLGCPVMVQCDLYASSVVVEGKSARLAEPAGVWGGRTALERHRAFIKTRHQLAPAAPDVRFNTEQKRAVLRALAVHADPYAVAAAAGVDVRTANWQRSKLTTLLGLPHDATRGQFLAAAADRGLLDGVTVVADDGTVPAVPPATKTVVTDLDGQVLLWAVDLDELRRKQGRSRNPRGRRRVSLRVWFADVAGQLDLLLADLDVDDLADVRNLFPSEPLEAAA
jgi:hypothetical protein